MSFYALRHKYGNDWEIVWYKINKTLQGVLLLDNGITH